MSAGEDVRYEMIVFATSLRVGDRILAAREREVDHWHAWSNAEVTNKDAITTGQAALSDVSSRGIWYKIMRLPERNEFGEEVP